LPMNFDLTGARKEGSNRMRAKKKAKSGSRSNEPRKG
jgi:hypothetical protein